MPSRRPFQSLTLYARISDITIKGISNAREKRRTKESDYTRNREHEHAVVPVPQYPCSPAYDSIANEVLPFQMLQWQFITQTVNMRYSR